MKIFSFFAVLLLAIFLIGCSENENSVSVTEAAKISTDNNSTGVPFVEECLSLTKTVDGITGDSLILDTVYTNLQGAIVEVHARLRILPNSFTGTREISMVPNLNDGSIQFFPEMVFDKPLHLDLKYIGVDLKKLGFTPHTEINFVFISDEGEIEFLSNNGVKMLWNQSTLFVNNALLEHFSRYAFVR